MCNNFDGWNNCGCNNCGSTGCFDADCGFSTAIPSSCGGNCGCAMVSRCRILANEIACLTRRINDLEDYVSCHPNDRLARCILCESARTLSKKECEYASCCQGCNPCNDGCGCGDII